MEDFGETLVDIRERLADPLPVRLRRSRVFLTAFLETFAAMPLRLMKRDFLPSVTVHPNVRLARFEDDLDRLLGEFKVLRDRDCTLEQANQARAVLDAALANQQARWSYEQNLWNTAVQAGMFLGTLSSTLLMIGASMSMITDHPAVNLYLIVAFLLSQGMVATVCINGWHTR